MSNEDITNRLKSEADLWIARKEAERADEAMKRQRANSAQLIGMALALAFAIIGGFSAIYVFVVYFITRVPR